MLRALGLASPREADETPGSLSTPINSGPPMTDADAERLRRIAHHLSDELGPILASVEFPTPDCALPEVSEAIEEITQIENELSAPRLAALCPEERASLFSEIAAILLDPGGNGGESRYREALDQTLGRWNRRKIRRIVEETSVDAIKSYDHTAWGNELRAIAAAQTIDRNGRDMRSVLRALLVMENENPSQLNFEDTDISTLVSSSDSACRLLVRITTMLCERLEHDR